MVKRPAAKERKKRRDVLKEIEQRSKSSRVSREWYHVNGQRFDGCSGMMNQGTAEGAGRYFMMLDDATDSSARRLGGCMRLAKRGNGQCLRLCMIFQFSRCS